MIGYRNVRICNHRRIADEYCGGGVLQQLLNFRRIFSYRIMRIREFIVRVIGTLLTVSYLTVYSMKISIIYHCIEMCNSKYTKTMKMKNYLMCIVCHSRVGYVFIGDE